MSSGITLTTGVRNNLLALQQISSQETTTQERLATGKKVNSALDNPTEFFTASSLSARAGELTNLLDSMSNAVNTINAASNGLTSITTTIQSLESTATQALQDSSWQSTNYTINTTAIGSTSIKSIGFSGGAVGSTVVAVDLNDTQQALTGSSNGFTGTTTGELGGSTAGTTITIQASDINGGAAVTVTLASSDTVSAAAAAINTAAGATVATTTSGGELQLNDPGQSNTLTVGGTASALALVGLSASATTFTGATTGFTGTTTGELGGAASQTFTIQAADINGGNAVTVTLASTDLVSNAVAAINTAAGATVATTIAGGELSLSDPGGGKLTLSGTSATLTSLGINGTTASSVSALQVGTPATVDQLVTLINNNSKLSGFVKASDNAGQLQIQNLSISALTVTGVGASNGEIDGSSGTNTIAGNSVRGNLVSQFNELRDQLDKTAADSSFNGVNLLNGDALKVFFNETSTSTLTIQSTNTNGINSNTLGISSATDAEFQNNTDLQTRLQSLSTALNTVSSQASDFGSNLSIVQNRQDFTNALVNTLTTGADDLTNADTNLEGANLLALQTQQQLSITSLSLASQANQAVLRLFG